ncbi:MAG: fasciclin domain-containing protein [Marinilabiliaceae bacterium]|nr:fasciclin domain-containing protein [Marinilabiliaceae bacterium]
MNKNPIILLFAVVLMFTGCTDAWEDHIAVSANVSQQSMATYLAQNTDCSQFAALLKETGLDRQLDSSKIYTAWVPDNSAMTLVDPLLIDTEDEKKAFVLNHLFVGRISALSGGDTDSLLMLSGKKLLYQPANALVDGVELLINKETAVKNGVVQFVKSPLTPRLSIWEWILQAAPDLKFVSFVKSLDYWYFDVEASGYLGRDDNGKPIYNDSIVVLRNQFLQGVADLSCEDSLFTLLVPSDELFEAHFNRFEKYYRLDDRESNAVPTARDSAFIWLNVARDFVSSGAQMNLEAPAILRSVAGVNVPFDPASVTLSYRASNGMVHVVSACELTAADKILPMVIDANLQTVFSTKSNYGTPALSYRERANALNGYDVVLDNHSNSDTDILDGLVVQGGIVNSCRYRVKIRAFDDFGKSYRYSNSLVALQQMVGPVTIIRNPVDYSYKELSVITNKLTDDSDDVDYSSSYYVTVPQGTYRPLSDAAADEVDLGSYNFRNADYAFFRLVPLSAKMAVTLDYIRLEPILED